MCFIQNQSYLNSHHVGHRQSDNSVAISSINLFNVSIASNHTENSSIDQTLLLDSKPGSKISSRNQTLGKRFS